MQYCGLYAVENSGEGGLLRWERVAKAGCVRVWLRWSRDGVFNSLSVCVRDGWMDGRINKEKARHEQPVNGDN